jgi:tetratricopeptide (TPR) repeat protein
MNMLAQINEAFKFIEDDHVIEATNIFNDIIGVQTNDLEEIVELGKLAYLLDENVCAIRSFSKAVDIAPENFDFLYFLAMSYCKIGNLTYAAEMGRKAIEINPKRHEPYIILGREATQREKFTEAVDFFKKAIEFKPSDPDPYAEIAICLRRLKKYEEALKYSQKLVRLDPTAPSYISLSAVMLELGQMEEAVSVLEKAIRIDSTSGHAYYRLAMMKKGMDDDRKLIRQAEKALKKSMPSSQRAIINFSLGKMYGDYKEWDKSFEYYRQGNLLAKPAIEPKWISDKYKSSKKIYTNSFVNNSEKCGSDSDVPVFIVGMPRSGTTLMEQIISTHPQGAGAGELTEFGRIHLQIYPDKKIPAKDLKNNLSCESLGKYAEEYLSVLRDSRKDAARVVDKMPNNFPYMGLMYKLFPNARFIHAMRSPLDTCLSCFFQHLDYVPETFDLEWLGKYYQTYKDAIKYWKKVLPEGKILDVSYDHLVNDFENESRRIIDFCGLPWDSKCLEFHKTERPITTASVWQARQPVYSSSRRSWVNYAPHLVGLANQLSEYLDEEDLAELEKRNIKIKKKWSMGFLKR